MAKHRTESEIAAGQLISAIQKEWGKELGNNNAPVSEAVMDLAHELLQAKSTENIKSILGQRTVAEFLGELWVARHPSVIPAIKGLEEALGNVHA